MKRLFLSLLLLGVICCLVVPVSAEEPVWPPIPWFNTKISPDTCDFAHLEDCKITVTAIYGSFGYYYEWDIWMWWNPFQLSLIKPMRMCLYEDIGPGWDRCYGADYDGGRQIILQIIDNTLPIGTHLGVNVEGRPIGYQPFDTTRYTTIPEFPTPVLPVITITGFLVAVLFIRRTREH